MTVLNALAAVILGLITSIGFTLLMGRLSENADLPVPSEAVQWAIMLAVWGITSITIAIYDAR